MRLRGTTASWVVVVGLLLPAAAAPAEEAAAAQRIHRSEFTVPAGLRSQVDFWKNVFATYSEHQVVIHDTLHLDRVYKVLDFRRLVDAGVSTAELEGIKLRTVRAEQENVRNILLRLDQLSPDSQTSSVLSAREREIWALFNRVKDRDCFRKAARTDRLRTQSGLRERFRRSLEVGARYWPEIERVFREQAVPLEVTRLPLIESSFNLRAYSKAGAAGVWQFMPATGRRYLQIDEAVDERMDPIIAARAAARHLRENYEALGTWPLAITAYNHGQAGIARAVATVGSTDIVDIVQRYHGERFKFASRNFYAEFLAALEVEQEAGKHFGILRPEPPLPKLVVRVPDYVGLSTLARCADTSVESLAELNPALRPKVVEGKLRVPRGYGLRVPSGNQKLFQQRYASLGPGPKFTGQARLEVVHKVKRGQTLLAIARQYGTSVKAIQQRNNLRHTVIRTGQTLRIPRG